MPTRHPLGFPDAHIIVVTQYDGHLADISKCKPGAKGKTFSGYELTDFVKREPTTEQKIAQHLKGLGPGFVKGVLKGVNTDTNSAAQRMKFNW